MRFSAWLAAGKLTLLSRSSTTSRTTDGEYLSWARVFFHGGSGSVAPASLNRRYAIAHRILSWNQGALAFFLQKSVDFPLEKARFFGVLPAAAYWQSACQRSFVALPHQAISEKSRQSETAIPAYPIPSFATGFFRIQRFRPQTNQEDSDRCLVRLPEM